MSKWSEYEFEYEYDESTWIVNLSYATYKERCADGGRWISVGSMEVDDITILDHNLEDITFYVRISDPKLYKKISSWAEERVSEAISNFASNHDEDAWKGYD